MTVKKDNQQIKKSKTYCKTCKENSADVNGYCKKCCLCCEESGQDNQQIIEEFEDNLLSESIDNEDGILICEIDVFRKHAKKALSSQESELKAQGRKEIDKEIGKQEKIIGNGQFTIFDWRIARCKKQMLSELLKKL